MKTINILACLMFFNLSILGLFNIIPIDESLSSHQEAFKDFEQYASRSKVDVSHYRTFNANVIVHNYEFPSLKAKKSFDIYKAHYDRLIGLLYMNSILKELILGFIESYHYKFFKSDNFFNNNPICLDCI